MKCIVEKLLSKKLIIYYFISTEFSKMNFSPKKKLIHQGQIVTVQDLAPVGSRVASPMTRWVDPLDCWVDSHYGTYFWTHRYFIVIECRYFWKYQIVFDRYHTISRKTVPQWPPVSGGLQEFIFTSTNSHRIY